MPRRNASRLSVLSLLMLLLVGCTAVKELPVTAVPGEATPAVLSGLPSMNRDIECLSASVRMTAVINGESAKAKGKLRLKSGEGVQVGATAMGLMEAACFEFLPQEVRFIYKIDKIYAASPYAQVPFFHESGTGYSVLESLLMNRMFTQDGAPLDKGLEGVAIDDGDDSVILTVSQPHSVYRYYIDRVSGNLVRCDGICGDKGAFTCLYSDFVTYDGGTFPSRMELSFEGGGTTASLLLELRDIKSAAFSFSPRRISSSYEKVSLQWVVNSVGESME